MNYFSLLLRGFHSLKHISSFLNTNIWSQFCNLIKNYYNNKAQSNVSSRLLLKPLNSILKGTRFVILKLECLHFNESEYRARY